MPPPLGKLSCEIFVTVDAELGGVGKVGKELQEERAAIEGRRFFCEKCVGELERQA
jgi:hypothetical protein